MNYQLLYTKSAKKDIQKLDPVAKKRLGKKLMQYSQNPVKYAKSLTNLAIGSYRWRIGNYRVVFDLHDRRIVVLRVRHRREVYK